MAYPKGVEVPQRKGKMNSQIEIKNVRLSLDENQVCLLDTLIETVKADYPSEWANNSMYEEIRQIIKSKVMEIIA